MTDSYYPTVAAYEPLKDGGPYQEKLEEYFSMAGQVLTITVQMTDPHYDVATVANPGLSNVVGDMAGAIGSTIGFYMDNYKNIENNIEAVIINMNDPNFWVNSQDD
ncbi:hypothetical protein ACU8YE_23220 [Ralstonia sp. VS2407]